jgi:hypothetical protein
VRADVSQETAERLWEGIVTERVLITGAAGRIGSALRPLPAPPDRVLRHRFAAGIRGADAFDPSDPALYRVGGSFCAMPLG